LPPSQSTSGLNSLANMSILGFVGSSVGGAVSGLSENRQTDPQSLLPLMTLQLKSFCLHSSCYLDRQASRGTMTESIVYDLTCRAYAHDSLLDFRLSLATVCSLNGAITDADADADADIGTTELGSPNIVRTNLRFQ
jgi:hypothetical protein